METYNVNNSARFLKLITTQNGMHEKRKCLFWHDMKNWNIIYECKSINLWWIYGIPIFMFFFFASFSNGTIIFLLLDCLSNWIKQTRDVNIKKLKKSIEFISFKGILRANNHFQFCSFPNRNKWRIIIGLIKVSFSLNCYQNAIRNRVSM